MESIRQTAQVYYKTMPGNVRSLAKEFFKKMDRNEDGKVSMAEFAGFMAEVGYVAMNNTSFFEEINKNKNGELDFDDVKTLYYILESGRPLCGGCRKFIKGMYFTCVTCFTCKAQSFCLHRDCFGSGEYIHRHSDFVDNYALLESIRREGLLGGDAQKNKSSKPSKFKPSTSTSLEIVPTSSKTSKPKPSTSTSLAIVPTSSKTSKFKPSTSTSLEIVPISSKTSKSNPSTSTSLVIVPTQRDERRRQRMAAWEQFRSAVGIGAGIAGIGAAIAQCTIL
ncbi:hypothetical protein LOK49_LG08G02582 [Camellia lanceoleosa]|uniref:Uncharacterized protein n=1 Tax=Camellia lanceoleosa TaxID=1840588 RepID=A0ACC0GS53_9ERIC|nr:hypothetical protein LOK49_LG08G02582 [Camellia lanceoleosa]